MQPLISICIPTVIGRELKFKLLCDFINSQIAEHSLHGGVEVIYLKDNKEISVGAKRQKLYEMARGVYSVQIDDDDSVSDHFVNSVYEACQIGHDCIGYLEHCNINHKHAGNSIITKNYPDWIETITPCPENHFTVRARTPYFKSPIKTELCRTAGVADMRWGEDHDFARRVLPLIKTEVFIPELMYFYKRVEEGTHQQRYGIK